MTNESTDFTKSRASRLEKQHYPVIHAIPCILETLTAYMKLTCGSHRRWLVESDGVWCHCGLKSTVTGTALFTVNSACQHNRKENNINVVVRQPSLSSELYQFSCRVKTYIQYHNSTQKHADHSDSNDSHVHKFSHCWFYRAALLWLAQSRDQRLKHSETHPMGVV